jgi:hypothetical protein
MITFRYLIYLLIIAFFSLNCHTERDPSPTNEKDFISLSIIQDKLPLLDKPGEEGNVIVQLPFKTEVTYLNEISDFTTELTLKNIAFNDPWLKVRLADGQEGWVYAGGVKFDTKGKGKKLAQAVINKRLAHFFGMRNGQMIEKYQQLFENAETALEFAEMYHLAAALKDSLNIAFNKIDVSANHEIPDLFWIEEPLPAILPMNIDSGAAFHLFFDYRIFAAKAATTIGEEDDEFIQLFTLIYTDSIEYLYPSWHLQTWEFGGNSLFGENKHIQILEQMDKISRQGELFAPFVQKIKIELLNDIIAANHYWQPKEKLIAELKKIIAADFKCLSDHDKIALEERMKMFESPKAYQIFVNQRDS